MPALDAFESLSEQDRAALIALFEHWGELDLGKRISDTRVNEEHENPKILAAKAGKNRFAMFHAGENIWVVCRWYVKQKQKLDNLGRAAIQRTIDDSRDYEKRVKAGKYYERS